MALLKKPTGFDIKMEANPRPRLDLAGKGASRDGSISLGGIQGIRKRPSIESHNPLVILVS